MKDNRVELAGVLAEVEPLRTSPAGVAIAQALLRHESWQTPGGRRQKAEAEVVLKASHDMARRLAACQAGQAVRVARFVARAGARNPQLVLWIIELEEKE